MARKLIVVTPENIPLEMELAGLANRFGALAVDFFFMVMILMFGAIGLRFLFVDDIVFRPTSTIFGFVVWFGYFIFFESFWNGQTPGKRAFGLRVMRDGGYPINFFAVATRNLLRLADFFPLFYAVGSLTVFFNEHYKRLGDMVAGTVVIKELHVPTVAMVLAGAAQRTGGILPQGVKNPYDVLTPEELELLRRYQMRRWSMMPDDAERFAYRLIVPLIPRLGVTFAPGVAPRYADLATVLLEAADRREQEVENAAWAS